MRCKTLAACGPLVRVPVCAVEPMVHVFTVSKQCIALCVAKARFIELWMHHDRGCQGAVPYANVVQIAHDFQQENEDWGDAGGYGVMAEDLNAQGRVTLREFCLYVPLLVALPLVTMPRLPCPGCHALVAMPLVTMPLVTMPLVAMPLVTTAGSTTAGSGTTRTVHHRP